LIYWGLINYDTDNLDCVKFKKNIVELIFAMINYI
jgi:hypothetical protein